jgi:hypothetical protein
MCYSLSISRHERWIIAGLTDVFVLLALGIHGRRAKPVQPGTPEYAIYLNDQVAVCLKHRESAERERLPVGVTATAPLDQAATCWFIVTLFDRLHPEARPYRY